MAERGAGFAQGQQLAQLRPSVTTPVTLYQVPAAPAGLRVELTLLFVALRDGASSTEINIFHDDDGTTYNDDTIIAGETKVDTDTDNIFQAQAVGGGIFVKAGGSIGVQVNNANDVNFTLYGITEQLAVERIRPR